jgi:hypothetical protein
MELSNRLNLSNTILDEPTNRYCEIYKITNLTTGKSYIGQAVSHILNHKRYRPYGREGRYRGHISEAFSTKKNQCQYLNNAIRKYGVDDFVLELVEYCYVDDADEKEVHYIKYYNTLYPYGLNLKNGGGNVFTHSDESKKRVSSGVEKYYKDKKFERFKDVKQINDDIEKYLKPLNRDNAQYGWYVYIDRKKADFGGTHISLEDSKQKAIEFIHTLKNHLAKHLDAGSSLESSTTTQ